MKLFITGASRGIGKQIMKSALQQGHDVAFTYCNPKTPVGDLLEEAKQIAPDQVCRAYRLDVKDSDEVAQVVDQVVDDFESIDAVVNNAGINRNSLAFNTSDEDWHEILNTNLSGAFYVIRQFLSVFLAERKGRFVQISSIAKDGLSGQAHYSATKAGLVGLSGAIAKEYGSKGITSNVVVPGMFETDLTKESLSDDLRRFWLQHCPVKRLGKLEELAEVVLFLASEGASFVNGQVISVTGGLDWGG